MPLEKFEGKKLNLMGDDYIVIKSFNEAMCIHGTRASMDREPFDSIDIEPNQKVYDLNVLETSSIVFKINKDDDFWLITMFGKMFQTMEGEPCDDAPISIYGDEIRRHRDERLKN